MQITDYIIDKYCTVMEAIQKINQNAKGVVYVCEQQVLLGSVTDGDIRRHIMNAGSVNAQVMEMMNHHPLYSYPDDQDKLQSIMKEHSVRSIPVLNRENKIVDVVFLNGQSSIKKQQLHIPVVIMAGGKGTRLYPYTQILPKPLIPIGEKTITEHIMERFTDFGCTHFDMIVNYKKHFIKSYFLDSENPVDVEFTDESEYLGTGGGLKLLEGKYDSTFFMTNCDILVEEDYGRILEYHKKSRNIITMVCAEKNMKIPYGTVDISPDNQALRINEKPTLSYLTNTGFYVIEPEFLNLVPRNTFIHITDVIQNCIDLHKRVGVYQISEEQWLDMGQMDEMERMRQRLNIR